MNREEFKNYVNEIAKNELKNGFQDNLMKTLNSAFIFKYVEKLEQENQKYKEVIDKAIELLGNYKHYSTPDEKQNSDNEDLVNNAFNILKEGE